MGFIWGLAVLPADIQDRGGAKTLLGRLPAMPRLTVVLADGAYAAVLAWVPQQLGGVLRTIKRPLGVKGYVHLAKRRLVERTFGWFGRYRRLSKDYEPNPASSEAWIYLTLTHRMARQFVPAREPDNRLGRIRRRSKRRCLTPSQVVDAVPHPIEQAASQPVSRPRDRLGGA